METGRARAGLSATIAMKKINRMIFWGALLTTSIVAACVKLRLLFASQAQNELNADVATAIFLFAAYLILVVGILVVGTGTYQNLSMRRADASLQTRTNRWHFNAGAAFCALALSFIFFPVL
jgi:hypothetical protein